jgi:ribose 5-phosphate isomerase B
MHYQHESRAMNKEAVGNKREYLRPMSFSIAIGCDHAGFTMKESIMDQLRRMGHVLDDKGACSTESVDYPDPAHAVARSVASGQARFGILICGSGNGVSIAANRHHGVRCALAWSRELARLARAHNDANVLALPARFIDPEEAIAAVTVFLGEKFEGGRHAKRVEKIDAC